MKFNYMPHISYIPNDDTTILNKDFKILQNTLLHTSDLVQSLLYVGHRFSASFISIDFSNKFKIWNSTKPQLSLILVK